MVDAITVLAVALLLAAVAGTVLPLVPGGSLSLAGVYLYWWHTGFAEPGPVALLVFTILGGGAILAELLGGPMAARHGGASWGTSAVAAAVAIVLTFVAGPLGLLAGLFGTVFALEVVRNGDPRSSARSALFATLGTLASTAVQVALTATVFLGFLVVVFVL